MDDQRVDAGILEGFDAQPLQRAPVVGDERRAPAAVAAQVGEHRPVALAAGDPGALVKNVRQAHAVGGQVGLLALFDEGGRVRNEQAVVLPQTLLAENEAALDVGEQGAGALLLEQGAAFRRAQREILAQALRVLAAQADAVFQPAPDACQRNQAEELRGDAQEFGQCRAGLGDLAAVDRARGACRQIAYQAQVVAERQRAAQAFGDAAQGLQQRRQRRAVGRFLQLADGLEEQRQSLVLGDRRHHARPAFEKGQRRFGAPAQFAEPAGGFEKGREFVVGERLLRRRVAVVEDVGDAGKTAVERGPGRLCFRVGHQPLAGVGHLADAGDGHGAQPKIAPMAWSRLSMMSGSSVIGRTIAIRQASAGALPWPISLAA